MYKSTIFTMFNRHIHIKKKYICANEGPFMLKELLKVINEEIKIKKYIPQTSNQY